MQKAVKIYVEFYSFFAFTISRNEQYIKEGVESIWLTFYQFQIREIIMKF